MIVLERTDEQGSDPRTTPATSKPEIVAGVGGRIQSINPTIRPGNVLFEDSSAQKFTTDEDSDVKTRLKDSSNPRGSLTFSILSK